MLPDTQAEVLRQMKTQAHIATSTYLDKITPILHKSDTTARQLTTSQHKTKSNAMTPHLGTLFETLQKWKTASQLPDCPNRSSMLATIARDTATRYLIPRTPQQPCTYHDWVQWGHSIQSHATMHLAQCGLHYADGIWGPDGPSQPEARKRQSQTLEDILRDLKPASGGGMLDALLCEVDEHGSAMPCYSKEGLTHAVKSQIESWSSDKATGTTAFALTHAFTDTLFHTTVDRRGLTRSTLRNDVEVSTHAAHHAPTSRYILA